jgi:hypothetical protein
MTQRGKMYECRKCSKEILVMREGKNLGPPMCCGFSMNEIKAKI